MNFPCYLSKKSYIYKENRIFKIFVLLKIALLLFENDHINRLQVNGHDLFIIEHCLFVVKYGRILGVLVVKACGEDTRRLMAEEVR